MSWFSFQSIPGPALQLGFAGALPFAALAILAFIFDWGAPFLILYGAVILSFMGGIHWGTSIAQDDPTMTRLGVSVVPALVGWLGAAVSGSIGLVLLALGFAALLLYDLYASGKKFVPAWYPSLRIPLTAIVVVCLLLAIAG